MDGQIGPSHLTINVKDCKKLSIIGVEPLNRVYYFNKIFVSRLAKVGSLKNMLLTRNCINYFYFFSFLQYYQAILILCRIWMSKLTMLCHCRYTYVCDRLTGLCSVGQPAYRLCMSKGINNKYSSDTLMLLQQTPRRHVEWVLIELHKDESEREQKRNDSTEICIYVWKNVSSALLQ